MRLIDAEELKEAHKSVYNKIWLEVNGIMSIIDDAQTIDAVPVVRGHWKEDDGRVRVCSVCDTDWCHKDEMDFEQYFNFCPNCGADMRGEQE